MDRLWNQRASAALMESFQMAQIFALIESGKKRGAGPMRARAPDDHFMFSLPVGRGLESVINELSPVIVHADVCRRIFLLGMWQGGNGGRDAGLLIEDVLLGSPGEGFFCGIQRLLLVRAQRGFLGLELVGGVPCLDCFFECGHSGGGRLRWLMVIDGC